MGNSKYGNVLTIVLIVIIIAIIALLGFFGYEAYRKKVIETDTQAAVDVFENMLNDQEDVEVEEEEAVTPNINVDDVEYSTNTGSGSSALYNGFEVIGTIEIPTNNVKLPILAPSALSLKGLETGVCTYDGMADLNESGSNSVLVAHNYRNGTFFSNNSKLEKGDIIYITDLSGTKMKYEVYQKYETSPSDMDYAVRETGEKSEISLSTCTTDSSKRLIIWAIEV